MALNTICHIEISCRNATGAGQFYNEMFGWKLNSDMGDDYIFFQPEDGVSGAFSKVEDFAPGNSVIFYVEVDDIDAFLKKAVELGGKLTVPKTEITQHGWFGHFTDPDGNTIGLFTALPK